MFDVVFLPPVWRNVAHTGVCVTSVAPTCSDSRLASLISISSAENVISACKLARKRLMKWVWQTAVIELACVAQESGTSFYHLLMESWVNRGSCVCVCLSILVCNTLRVNANVCVYVYFRIVFSWNSARTIKTRAGHHGGWGSGFILVLSRWTHTSRRQLQKQHNDQHITDISASDNTIQ